MTTLNSSHFFPLQSVAAGDSRKSGRAVCSDRGDAVWEWQVTTGVFERDVTEEQLRQLEAPDLQIVEFPAPNAYDTGRWIRESDQATALAGRTYRTAGSADRRAPARAAGPLGQLWARLRGGV